MLWCDIAHGSQHRDSSMLQFCLTTSLEVLDAPVSGKSGGVPESGRSLHTQLVFEVLFVALGLRSSHGVCSSELSSTFLVLDPTQKQVQEESSCVAKTFGRSCLDSQLVLEGTQRRGGVIGPVAPCTASQAVLYCTVKLLRPILHMLS